MINSKILFLSVMALFCLAHSLLASNFTDNKFGVITGKVIDAETQQAIEYANVSLFNLSDSSLVTGTITSVDGRFVLNKLPLGNYFIEISFIGFEKRTQKISITDQNLEFTMKQVVLSAQSHSIDDVSVLGEKTNVRYEIDKQVINVGKDATAAGGSAVEVLENTPSVNVDADGNVLLRGSKDFTVLINGKPTQLSGSEALRQVPAKSIENIELITNPSAKYDADGASGIINIIVKKNSMLGFNGLLNTSIGTGNKYSSNGAFNFRKEKLNIFTGFEFSDYQNFSEIEQSNVIFHDKGNKYQNAFIDNYYFNEALVFNLGFEHDINAKSSLSAEGKGGRRGYDNKTETESNAYTDLYPSKNYRSSYKYFDVYGDILEFMFDYKNKIADNHTFSLTAHYQSWDGYDAEDLNDSDIRSSEKRIYQKHYYKKTNFSYITRINADYKMPLGDNGIIEAGYQFKYNNRDEDLKFEDYDTDTEIMVHNATFSNKLKYQRYIHAGYLIYSGEYKGIKYQIGIRGEYTDRNINIDSESVEKQEYVMNKAPDWFPSIHLSKECKNQQSVQASYSRRITRPNAWLLNTNPKYMDATNVMYGAPDILPQFTNSLELNYRKVFKKGSASVQTFYRHTTDVFAHERKPVEGTNRFKHQLINGKSKENMGAEINISVDAIKWMKINSGTSLYNTVEEGEINHEDKSESNFVWNTYLNTTFILKWGTRIQSMIYYSGPTKSLYGDQSSFYVINLGANQSFMEGKLTIGLSARNVFNTLKFDFNAKDALGNGNYHVIQEGPIVMLNLSYRINNFKNKQRGKHDDAEYSGGGF